MRYTLPVIILFFFCQTTLAQSLTAKDSADFQQSLAQSQTDFDRINYQLKLAEYSIRKPGSYKADLDNARMRIAKAKQLNAQLKSAESAGHILFEEFYLQQESGPSAKGKAMIQEVIPLLQNGTDKCLLAVAYKELSYYSSLENRTELTTKIDLIKRSVALFKECGNKFKTANTLQYLADLYIYSANYQLALNAMDESLSIYNSIHFRQIQGLYDLYGQRDYILADYNNCLKYELLALQTSERLKDSTMQACEIYNHVGVTLVQLDQMNKAILYFNAAQLLAEKNNDMNSVFEVSFNLTDCYNKLDEPKQALIILKDISRKYKDAFREDYIKVGIDCQYLATFIRLKQFDNAHFYAEKLLGFINSPSIGINTLSNIYNELISYYFLTKNYRQESAYLIKGQQVADKLADPSKRMTNLKYWYKLDSAQKDYPAAFFHLLQYKALGDSIFDEKKTRQIGQLQVQYETQQKEDELRLKSQDIEILTQNAKLDQAQLKGARVSRNMFLAGVLVFILIAAMLYRRYHEKQKLNILITDKNTALQKLVTEKEWLLKEVHHRVKNNLHTVICLLESQAAYLENDALEAIEHSQHRIYAMSLIHQKLYQSTDTQTIDMAVYLPEFIIYLKESFGTPSNITFQQEIKSIRLDVAQAIPLALIVNEAVTNAIKYAFPDNRAGVIKIALRQQDDLIRLMIDDSGIGMPGSIKPHESPSLGLELMRGLTDDLKGKIEFLSKNGTSVIVSFKSDPFNRL